MQFVSLKLMWRKPRKAFTSHRCRHRWLEHRCTYTCAAAAWPDLQFRCAVNVHVWSKAFQFCFFFSLLVSHSKRWYLLLLELNYTEWVYKRWRARQIFFICAHNLKQLSCVYFSSWTYVCNWCVASCCILIGTLIPQYLFSLWFFPRPPKQYSDQIKWSLWKYILIIICLRVLRSLCIYAYRRPFVDGVNENKWSTVDMQFKFRVRRVSWPKSEVEAEKHIDSSHWVLDWNDFEWERGNDDKSWLFPALESLNTSAGTALPEASFRCCSRIILIYSGKIENRLSLSRRFRRDRRNPIYLHIWAARCSQNIAERRTFFSIVRINVISWFYCCPSCKFIRIKLFVFGLSARWSNASHLLRNGISHERLPRPLALWIGQMGRQ